MMTVLGNPRLGVVFFCPGLRKPEVINIDCEPNITNRYGPPISSQTLQRNLKIEKILNSVSRSGWLRTQPGKTSDCTVQALCTHLVSPVCKPTHYLGLTWLVSSQGWILRIQNWDIRQIYVMKNTMSNDRNIDITKNNGYWFYEIFCNNYPPLNQSHSSLYSVHQHNSLHGPCLAGFTGEYCNNNTKILDDYTIKKM